MKTTTATEREAKEMKLALDSLTVRRKMMVDCYEITKGERREHYRECIAKIDAELADLDRIQMHIEAAEAEAVRS